MEQKLRKIETIICGLMLYTVLFIIVVGVVRRYIINAPLIWIEEASNMLYVWIVFVGAAITFRDNDMVKMDFIYSIFPTKIKKILNFVFNIVITSTSLFLIPSALKFLVNISKVQTMILKISWAFLFWPILFIFIFLAISGFFKIIISIKDLKVN